MNKNRPKKIVIVGGGTAGLISALILKTKFNVDISIVKSDQIGIIGVGEGSTEHWNQFLLFCGIDYKELILETDATIKRGVYFTNGWAKQNYYHNVGSFKLEKSFGQIHYGALNSLTKGENPILTSDYFNLNNLIGVNQHKSPSNQYHFNTFKLNSFLLKKCNERDIKIINDTIIDIEIDDKGIKKLKGLIDYKADFYIDCTGFKRLLISKLNAKWISYSNHLQMNEAIAFPTGDTDEYTPYTESRRLSSGWMWRIPTYGRWGNGYVFNSNLINADKAKQEIEHELGYKVEVAKHVKFDPGALDKCLVKNCLAVGLAANFVEPLEATSIGTTINQMFLFNNYFMHLDSEYFINEFNNKINLIMDNIKDFVLIHYLNDKSIKFSISLKEKLKIWKKRPPIREDFTDSSFFLFYSANYIQVLCGVNFYTKEEIKKYLNNLNSEITSQFDKVIREDHIEYMLNKKNYISHKKFLDNLRKNC